MLAKRLDGSFTAFKSTILKQKRYNVALHSKGMREADLMKKSLENSDYV
jgi:hypothetical protein